jgi:hypothetical protein
VLSEDDKKWIRDLLDERLDEKLERLETKLLTAFHNWASPMESRLRSHSALLRALDLEVEQLDDRLKKLEPPPNQPS